MVKNPPANAGGAGSIPESGRSSGVGDGNPLQSPCLGEPMNRGAWQAIVHWVTKDPIYRLKNKKLHTKLLLTVVIGVKSRN